MNDLDKPLPIQREPLEKEIQAACVRWAREKGAYCRKFSSPANRSVPDYIVLYRGLTRYVEFKKEDGELTERQDEEHREIRAAGGVVWTIRGVGQFKRFWEQTWG